MVVVGAPWPHLTPSCNGQKEETWRGDRESNKGEGKTDKEGQRNPQGRMEKHRGDMVYIEMHREA